MERRTERRGREGGRKDSLALRASCDRSAVRCNATIINEERHRAVAEEEEEREREREPIITEHKARTTRESCCDFTLHTHHLNRPMRPMRR